MRSLRFAVQVDWDEISAAWGYTVLLLYEMARRQNFEFTRYRLIPRGSFSAIEDKDESRCMELFGSREIKWDTMFWFGRFNDAMKAFLNCVLQFGFFVKTLDSNFKLPYPIRDDKIGHVSICYQRMGNNVEWCRALRNTLIALSLLQRWEAMYNNHESDNEAE